MFLDEEQILNSLIENHFEINKLLKIIDDYEIDIQIREFINFFETTKNFYGWEGINSLEILGISTIGGVYPEARILFNFLYNSFTKNMYRPNIKLTRYNRFEYISDINVVRLANVIKDNFEKWGALTYFKILETIKALKDKNVKFREILGDERCDFILDNVNKGLYIHEPLEKIKLEE